MISKSRSATLAIRFVMAETGKLLPSLTNTGWSMTLEFDINDLPDAEHCWVIFQDTGNVQACPCPTLSPYYNLSTIPT
jgi:hypothetical protein